MDGYVSKPIRPDILFSELERFVPSSPPQEIIATKAPGAAGAVAGMVSDRSALLDRVEGDMELLGDIIDLFKDDSVRQIAAIREGIGKKEPSS